MNKTFTIGDEMGLHARPATVIVNTAGKFSSDITLMYKDKSINLKSIMGLMSLGVPHKAEITITAEGSDAEEALTALEKTFLEQKLTSN